MNAKSAGRSFLIIMPKSSRWRGKAPGARLHLRLIVAGSPVRSLVGLRRAPVVVGDEIGQVGLVVAATIVVPEDVGARRRAVAARRLGRGARHLAVDQPREDLLAVAAVERSAERRVGSAR